LVARFEEGTQTGFSRTVFGPKIDSVRGEWRRLHNKELHALYLSPNINRAVKSKIMKWAENVARMESRGAYRVLLGKCEGRRPLGRPRHRREYNIKMDRSVIWAWIESICFRIWAFCVLLRMR
jgi:hypothetical protein